MDRRDYFANYSSYPNGTRFDKQKMKLIVPLYNENDEEEDVEFPCHMEVCNTCGGTGKHVNPSIDAHGITEEEWEQDWSYEDREAYFSGAYDVTCYECHGNNVVPEIDRERSNKESLIRLDKWMEDEADYRSQCESERRYGC